MSTRYAPSRSSPPPRTASATLSGGARSGTRHGTSPGGIMIVWAGLSLDMLVMMASVPLDAHPASQPQRPSPRQAFCCALKSRRAVMHSLTPVAKSHDDVMRTHQDGADSCRMQMRNYATALPPVAGPAAALLLTACGSCHVPS